MSRCDLALESEKRDSALDSRQRHTLHWTRNGPLTSASATLSRCRDRSCACSSMRTSSRRSFDWTHANCQVRASDRQTATGDWRILRGARGGDSCSAPRRVHASPPSGNSESYIGLGAVHRLNDPLRHVGLWFAAATFGGIPARPRRCVHLRVMYLRFWRLHISQNMRMFMLSVVRGE